MRIVDDETAMTLGMRSGVEMGKARALGPANPRVRLLEGISALHAPEMWGGGQDAALAHFLAAVELFAHDEPKRPLPAWGLAETYAWLGQTYAALGKVEEARAAYERALEVEPEYAWVRDVLLPRAWEIDARGDSLTVDKLRRIAAEAGIDPQATSRAIQEILSDEEPGSEMAPAESTGVPAMRSKSPAPARILVGGAIAARGRNPPGIRAALHPRWTASLCVAPRGRIAVLFPLRSALPARQST